MSTAICTMCGRPSWFYTRGDEAARSQCCDALIRWEAEGRKDDAEKPRMDLLPFEALEEVAKVLTFGAKKYADNNWQKVKDAEGCYVAALLRHLSAYNQGKTFDEESGLSHAAHMATNALFILWFEIQKEKGKEYGQ